MQNDATKKIKSALKEKKAPPVKVVLFSIAAFLAIALAFWLIWRSVSEPIEANPSDSINNGIPVVSVKIGDRTFGAEIAESAQQQAKGLSGRESLKANEAMLFVYDTPGSYSFWMKDMKMSIDMIWIDQHKKIVHMEHGVSPDTFPKSFNASTPSQYVLEIAAGEAKKAGFKNGDTVEFTLP